MLKLSKIGMKISGKEYYGAILFFSMIMIPCTLLMPVKSYLKCKTVDKILIAMDWPPRSPDLNIIEAVWDHLDREINKGQPKSKEKFWEKKEAWYNITEDYQSLQKRVQDVQREITLNTDFCL